MKSEVREKVCGFDNLYHAMWKAARNVKWKDSVAGYVKNGLINCYDLKQSLTNGTYKIDRYTQFTVYEPKKRAIVSTRIKDRVFQRSLCDNYLYDAITRSFIYDNGACQIGRGTDFARNRLVAHLQQARREYGGKFWVGKGDLQNFFGSTPHDVAKSAARKRVDDEWAEREVERIIDSFNQGADPDVGMGLGSQVTQLVQLAVLDDLDHYVKEVLHIRHYLRYMDDFIILHPDKEYVRYCMERIREWAELRGLRLSERKTQIFPIAQGIRFLGFRFRLTDTGRVVRTILPEKISHERRKLRRLVGLAKQGKMTRAEVDKCYNGWKRHAEYGDTYGLILKMDQFYKNLWRCDSNDDLQEHQPGKRRTAAHQ